ncbi:MAG: TonB-dependent receptor, partial [Halioglobus sp.]
LDLTFGIRYTDDEREAQRTFDAWPFNLFANGASDSSKDKVDYTLIADYSWSDDVSTYFKVATGFRSGGSSRNGADFSQTFDNEDLISYELGWKTELADGKVRLNGAIFSMMIDDIILDYLPDPVNTPQVVEVFNSGEADVNGLEIDLEATVTENLYIGFNFAYLDYDFDDVIFPNGQDQTDNTELVWAPEYALSIRADYNVPVSVGELRMHLDYSWQDDQFALANTNFGEVIVGDYGLLNARLGLADVKLFGGDWQFALWGKNITDEDSANYQIGSTSATYLQPATYGVEARLALD